MCGAGDVHHTDGEMDKFDPGCFLGISADLADELCDIFLLLPTCRLDACLRRVIPLLIEHSYPNSEVGKRRNGSIRGKLGLKKKNDPSI